MGQKEPSIHGCEDLILCLFSDVPRPWSGLVTLLRVVTGPHEWRRNYTNNISLKKVHLGSLRNSMAPMTLIDSTSVRVASQRWIMMTTNILNAGEPCPKVKKKWMIKMNMCPA